MSIPTPIEDAQSDLAFLRSLVAGADDFQRQFGQTYFAAGVCYTTELALHFTQATLNWLTTPTAAMLVGFGPTVVFLGLLAWLLRRHQLRSPAPPTASNRAIGAVFQSVGLANLALAAVVGGVAWRAHSLELWALFPCIVMILQGAAWLVAWQVRRHAWFAAVAGGWFATGIGMSFAIGLPAAYVAIAGAGMFAFMLVPGLVLMRQPRAA